MSTTIPETYADPECEAAHQATYERVPRHPIKPVLPPGVSEADFAQVIQQFSDAVGKNAVFINEGLSDYIDPYDVNEADDGKRKVPSAAVWSAVTIADNTNPEYLRHLS